MTFFGATLLTAIPTVVLAVFAVVTAWYARKAFREQSKDVRDQAKMLQVQADQLAEDRKVNAEQIRVLGLQAEELKQAAADRERQALERRRAQAVQVYMWKKYENKECVYRIRNTSRQPIYELRLQYLHHWAEYEDPSSEDRASPLMPGEEHTSIFPSTDDEWFTHVFAIFRDSAGVWWAMRPNEEPKEIPPAPMGGLRPEPDADRTTGGEVADDAGEQFS